MNLVQKIKKLSQSLDSVNIDMGVVQALDSDKLLKLYNVLTQLSALVESKGEFRRLIVNDLIEEVESLSKD